jgi:formylglycine-generating enzyme required for sulfatase activity
VKIASDVVTVGTYRNASWCGVYDLVGNVWEWCGDRYSGGYYAQSPSVDPKGSRLHALVVRRGGSWNNEPGNVRCGQRYFGSRDDRDASTGFRLIMECGER